MLNFTASLPNVAEFSLDFDEILAECCQNLPNSARVETQGRRVPSGAEKGWLPETIACNCTRPVCALLASSSAQPAAALRDFLPLLNKSPPVVEVACLRIVDLRVGLEEVVIIQVVLVVVVEPSCLTFL